MEKTFSTAENWAKKGCYTDKKKSQHEESFMYGVSKGVLESKVHLPTSCDPLQ